MSVLQRRSDKISECTQSVRCDHTMSPRDDAVVDIYAINLQLGAMAVCTGLAVFSLPWHKVCLCQNLWVRTRVHVMLLAANQTINLPLEARAAPFDCGPW